MAADRKLKLELGNVTLKYLRSEEYTATIIGWRTKRDGSMEEVEIELTDISIYNIGCLASQSHAAINQYENRVRGALAAARRCLRGEDN